MAAALDVTIALTALEFRKTDRTAALLLVPYLAWWALCCSSSCRRMLSGTFCAAFCDPVKPSALLTCESTRMAHASAADHPRHIDADKSSCLPL